MSGVPSDYHLSLDVGKEKSIIWLGTRYYDNISYSVDNMNANIIWKSSAFKYKYVDILLEFQFTRISELEFRLTCFQNKSAPYGYMLRFHCFMNIFHEYSPKVFHMRSNQYMIFEQFWLDPAYRQHFSPDKLSEKFYLKIKADMIEYDCSYTKVSVSQEDKFQLMKTRFFNDESVLTDLCYILNVPRLKDIFTGRQNAEFFVAKSNYIRRSAIFSKEIANYLRAKEAWIPVPLTNLGIILNFIKKRERTSINHVDLFELYFEAYFLGLNYLVTLTRDLVIGRFENNPIFVIVSLRAADHVCDEILFDKFAERFHYFERQNGNPEGWLKRFKSDNIRVRFSAHSLKRRLMMRESAGDVETPGTSASEKTKNIYL